MSENIPESIPTSISNRSSRPVKKQRAANTPTSQQSQQLETLFANPDRAEIGLNLGPKPKTLNAPPEIVANVQGSSAGAGSGEFHVYKASRRREYERLRTMDEEVREEEAEKEFLARKQEREKRDEEKLGKNRARREKARKRQERKKMVGSEGGSEADMKEKENGEGGGGGGVKRKLGPAKISVEKRVGEEDGAQGEAAQEEVGITIHDDD
ncbi:PRKR-interacting 1 [Lecanosticta acicola]|uniref:PRKR-interacting 1 n=1 Tax=Lecanosticta acicola TaxID=111012 RepID=A0AAI8YR60_9PEZI|nr:PRKR-interacting 1 [Lecanosticta acicola]